MSAAFGLWLAGLVCAPSPSIAHAQTTDVGNFLNLSVSGDGKTPSVLELAGMLTPSVSAPSASISASDTGDAGWSLPLSLPPARHMPQVGVSYASGGGPGVAGRGFSVSAGITLHEPTGREARAYLDDPGVIVVSGALDGLLVPDGGGYRWVSERAGAVVAVRHSDTEWTVSSGMTTWTLEARSDVDWVGLAGEPWRWRTVSSEDTLGNRVDYTWSGPRLVSAAYGGTSPSTHFLKVVFEHRTSSAVFREPDRGHVDLVDRRLAEIEVQTAYGHPGFEPRLRYQFSYDPTDEYLEHIDEQWIGEDNVARPPRLLAAFEYTGTPDNYEETSDVPPVLDQTWTWMATGTST